MIKWNEFEINNLQKIADLVGMENDRVSQKFLVVSKFNFEKFENFEVRFAKINFFRTIPKISVDGMTGNIDILNWSEINIPKEI